jgi:light-regulated signal transduction histidine kinase (bacteriophytochrome)
VIWTGTKNNGIFYQCDSSFIQFDHETLRDISTLEFYVEPHFYETAWFYVLVFLGIIFLLYILYKIRVRRIARRNMELQKLNQELDRFVYSASHDLRAPLASVQRLVKIAQQETSAEQKDEYLQMIRSSIQKLDGFTKEITDFSRNARAEVEREPVDFKELISGTVHDLQYLDKSERIRIDLKIVPYDSFISDQRRLSMIFHNLTSRAIIIIIPVKKILLLKYQLS